jgi:serine/threonine protein kinase
MTEDLHPGDDERFLLYAQIAEEIRTQLRAGQQPDVEELVRRHPQWEEQVRQLVPVLAVVGQLSTPPKEAEALVQLGEYRILREVGRGGMGVVYEAEQPSLRRRVALKVLPLAAALDARQLQRFRNEAQAAAQLHHSNIVPIYAVGCERGVHYYAMQFIDGRTLADLIAQQRQQAGLTAEAERPSDAATASLTAPAATATPETAAGNATDRSPTRRSYFRDVARLGAQAAEALECAHRQGVIHRDIKPANLMVDVRGHLWITDFGLARMLNEVGPTLSGDLVGTMRYMSPEQAAARRGLVDQRTDIYSLGATLYELLTLRPVCDGQGRLEVLRQITGEEPPAPRRLNKAIPPELETIVLKALGKDPAERYATAQEMADDLQRFLRHEPIRARRPTLLERARKWTRRHRTAVQVAATMLLLTAVGLGVSTALLYREQQRTQAALQAEAEGRRLARQAVDDMYTEVAEKWLKDQPRMQQVQREFLEKALKYYEGFAREPGDDPEICLEAAKAYRRIANLHRLLGNLDAAEKASREKLAICERLALEYPDRATYRAELAGAWHNLGILLEQVNRLPEAEAAERQALTRWRHLAAEFPDRPLASEVGIALQALGILRRRRGDLEEARRLGREAIEQQQAALKMEPANPRFRAALHLHCQGLAGTLAQSDEDAEADKVLALGLRTCEQLVAEYPDVPEHRYHLGVSYCNRAQLLQGHRRLAEAAADLDRARAVQEKLAADFPDVADYHANLANTLSTRAGLFLTADEAAARRDPAPLKEGVQLLRRAVASQRTALQLGPRKAAYRPFLLTQTWNLAMSLQRLGEHAETARVAEEMPAILADDWRGYLKGASTLAFCVVLARKDTRLTEAQRQATAQQYLDRARTWLQEAVRRGADRPEAQGELARTLIIAPTAELWDPETSLGLARKALERAPQSVLLWNTLGMAHYRRGEWQSAIEVLEKAEKLPYGSTGYNWFFLAMAHWQKGDKDRARRYYEQARDWRLKQRAGGEDLRRYHQEAAGLLGLEVQ